ncbi:hypothetical protein [Yersinia rohdei]|uniref:hypothetical protein n=1 Tax=Yersinia rohdei TaxID=29485 RepID=UPI0005DD2E06|nr:hypothetical protein [Yersinia rohdei]CQJ59582.1 Uncharacterised protein [Yersinia rohdei]
MFPFYGDYYPQKHSRYQLSNIAGNIGRTQRSIDYATIYHQAEEWVYAGILSNTSAIKESDISLVV